jgi:hypothetical protein
MKRTVESQPSRRERKENVDIERGTHKQDEGRPRAEPRNRRSSAAAANTKGARPFVSGSYFTAGHQQVAELLY